MKSALLQIAFYFLIYTGVRSLLQVRTEIREARAERSERLLVPVNSTLVGVDSGGHIIRPAFGSDGKLTGKGSLVVFVLHSQVAGSDVRFWNGVVDGVVQRATAKASRNVVQFWGVCDRGAACNIFGPTAHFKIAGYIDPYDMHTIGAGLLTDDVLIYNSNMILQKRGVRKINPLDEAALIAEQAR